MIMMHLGSMSVLYSNVHVCVCVCVCVCVHASDCGGSTYVATIAKMDTLPEVKRGVDGQGEREKDSPTGALERGRHVFQRLYHREMRDIALAPGTL